MSFETVTILPDPPTAEARPPARHDPARTRRPCSVAAWPSDRGLKVGAAPGPADRLKGWQSLHGNVFRWRKPVSGGARIGLPYLHVVNPLQIQYL